MSALRDQAADWYDSQSLREASGAVAVMFREFARRVRLGHADHRLPQLVTDQADFIAHESRPVTPSQTTHRISGE